MRALHVLFAIILVIAPIAGAVGPVAGGAQNSVDTDHTDGWATEHTELGEPIESEQRTGDSAPQAGATETLSAAVGADERFQVTAENRTFRTLSTPSDADPRVQFTNHGANLGSAMSFAVDETDAAMETAAVVERIERAESHTERQQQILAAVNRVERDEVSLHSRQTAAFDAHAAGELSDREFLDELVRIAATAREYDERLEALSELADETDGFSSPTRLDELQVALQVYDGPVREHAVAAVNGEIPTTEVYIESTDSAVVLATIDDDEYVREAFRTDRWDRGGGEISNDDAIEATATAYPETAALREPDAFGAGAVQRITIPHEFGTLRTFVSGGTEQVFVEHQRLELDTFPDTAVTTERGDGFNVTVDRTYPGGPVTVTVLDEETREPAAGITVTKSVGDDDSESIGSTDADGVVRTLSPAETYRITVVDEPRVVVVADLEPIETPRLVDDE